MTTLKKLPLILGAKLSRAYSKQFVKAKNHCIFLHVNNFARLTYILKAHCLYTPLLCP